MSAQAPDKSRLRIKPETPAYTDAVLVALGKIKGTEAGRAVFRRLLDTRRVVTIEPPAPPTDPPNAWTKWRDPPGKIEGEIVIAFDPADWPARQGGMQSDVVLFGRLADAAAMAEGGNGLVAGGEEVAPEIAAYLRERPER